MNINPSTTMEISRYEIAKLCSESIYFENKTENPYLFQLGSLKMFCILITQEIIKIYSFYG